MGTKIGEILVLRGSPPISRTLEVYVDEDFLPTSSGALTAQQEQCVSFREVSQANGRTQIIFSRSVSSTEARAFAELLRAAADVLEGLGEPDPV